MYWVSYSQIITQGNNTPIVFTLQSSVSNDPSEIILIYWFDAQETLIIVTTIKAENSCAA